jgi:hypothetical protein
MIIPYRMTIYDDLALAYEFNENEDLPVIAELHFCYGSGTRCARTLDELMQNLKDEFKNDKISNYLYKEY